MGQICTLGYGKANLSDTLVTYANMKVVAPFSRTSAVTSGRRHGQNSSSPVGRFDMTGALITARSEHENGTIILLQASWKRMRAPVADGALFFRLRAGAPLYRVDAKVPTGRENMYGDRFTIFSAYADIMNPDDLQQAGIVLPAQYENKFMSDEEIQECFYLMQLAPESAPRPAPVAILGAAGVVYREMAQVPARRIRIRRAG